MKPVEVFAELIIKSRAKNVGVIETEVRTNASDVNDKVCVVVTEVAKPRPSNVAIPLTALTVRD